jgi:hypothetical protein
MAIFRPKPFQIFFFGLVPKSLFHIGLIYVKNPEPNISCLGPFKGEPALKIGTVRLVLSIEGKMSVELLGFKI